MIKKIIQIFICACYWLCIVPSLTYFLYHQNILRPKKAMEYFIHYTIYFFVLILVYWMIHHIFENCYMKHEIRKKVRKITIKRQLERLERGEIPLEDAQRFSTFTKPKSPKTKRKAGAKKSPSGTSLASQTGTKGPRRGRDNLAMQQEAATVQREKKLMRAPRVPPPTYSETVTCDANTLAAMQTPPS